ncbi:hypothetical protein cyc_08407 [Cyclospora cayetanensis]|uniref:Transmembrane protein 231 n=1 Tax=Cyclospora cayetanensis TaxID=88456 RepID=A0A1D3D0X5_9EIME|nr:hypothetical protein cyc_08407 [Cyclospora cayetanensis]
MLYGCSIVHRSSVCRRFATRRFSRPWILCMALRLVCLFVPIYFAFHKDGWWFSAPSSVPVAGDLSLKTVTLAYFSVGGGPYCAWGPYGGPAGPCGFVGTPGEGVKQISLSGTGRTEAFAAADWELEANVTEETLAGNIFRVYIHLKPMHEAATTLPPIVAAELSLRVDATSPVYMQLTSSEWVEQPFAGPAAAAETAVEGFTVELSLEVPKGQRRHRLPNGIDAFGEFLQKIIVPIVFFLWSCHYLTSLLIRWSLLRVALLPSDPLIRT